MCLNKQNINIIVKKILQLSHFSGNRVKNVGNFMKDIYVWTFVTYDAKNEVYKVNIRSKGPVINEVAMKYHGGGHKMASGVRTPNKEDIEGLLQDLDETCRKYKESREK